MESRAKEDIIKRFISVRCASCSTVCRDLDAFEEYWKKMHLALGKTPSMLFSKDSVSVRAITDFHP